MALRHVTAASEIERESDPVQLRLLVARVVLADTLQATWLEELPADQVPTAVREMESRRRLAADWAADALWTRPLTWEGALVLGGTRFLAAWRSPEDSVYEAPERWLAPLELAHRLAPIEAEPPRLKAAALLVAWPGLSPAARHAAIPAIRTAFEDPASLRILLADWRGAASSDEIFESVLPDSQGTWSLLLDVYARENRWDAYCDTRPRWWRSVLDEGRRLASEGSRQRSLGDPPRARGTFLALLETIPIDRRAAPLVERALEELPPGPVRSGVTVRLEEWLIWALPLRSRGLASLSPRTFGRIASLGAGALPPELEAGAWLAAGDLRTAATAEAKSDRLWAEEWGPYFLAKARILWEREREAEAVEALSAVHASLTGGWTYRTLSHRLGLSEDLPEVTGSWPGTDWRWRGSNARLEIALAAETPGLRIHVDEVAGGLGGWILTVDGREALCTPVRSEALVDLDQMLSPGVHWLQGRPAGAARVVPGDVEVGTTGRR